MTKATTGARGGNTVEMKALTPPQTLVGDKRSSEEFDPDPDDDSGVRISSRSCCSCHTFVEFVEINGVEVDVGKVVDM